MHDFTDFIDLASERLGGAVLYANDEFFAEKENLLRASAPVFLDGKYTDRGKWMDGWESRRRRVPGNDFALVRLGLPGLVRGVVLDTAFFRGNYPSHASISACAARADASPEELLSEKTRWIEILAKSPLQGDSKNAFSIDAPWRFSHLRLDIYPDGGVARLRVHGEAVPDGRQLGRHDLDLAAVEEGAMSLACSDMFFGERQNLLMPGRAANMGDGWETRRRRGPGHDWNLVRLAVPGHLRAVEIDTNHFKGNYPDTAEIEGVLLPGADVPALHNATWTPVVARTKLQAHTRHLFTDELLSRGPFSHLRLSVYPDGGVSRLRAWGTPSDDGLRAARLHWLDTLAPPDAEALFRSCNASTAWAKAMTAARPFGNETALLAVAERTWSTATDADLREAMAGHPRIGERSTDARANAEQAGAATADAATLAALAEGNRAYEAKFGHVYLVFATGKSAAEMLAILNERLARTPAEELATARDEQRKITENRLRKLYA
jgi:allantoicase